MPAEPGAQLRKPHRIVGVEQGLAGLGPVLRQQLEHDEQPGETKQEREIRLARRGHGN